MKIEREHDSLLVADQSKRFDCSVPNRWLAFELSVLRRLRFSSVIEPFAGDALLGARLKRWGARVVVNDIARWAWTCGVARVQNNAAQLDESDINLVLEDAYVPRYRLHNAALRRWFGEADACWLDNVRQNIERLPNAASRAVALVTAMMTGDYALSFTAGTARLRQPLSQVFRRLWQTLPPPFDNGQTNTAANEEASALVAEQKADLLFVRLPRPRPQRRWAWRETWVRGDDAWQREICATLANRLGAIVASKQQFFRSLEELLEAAKQIPQWAIAWTEDGSILAEEIAQVVSRLRKVDTIYTKDFSELMNGRATIITAAV
ncbi:MAG: hypothetical protein C4334_01420 [Pyrinomonas sp.]|uniref:hypothetical protein n=1 Tax=Pyrinomonas sp. TaxID=2080306 RepID=UPI00331929BF